MSLEIRCHPCATFRGLFILGSYRNTWVATNLSSKNPCLPWRFFRVFQITILLSALKTTSAYFGFTLINKSSLPVTKVSFCSLYISLSLSDWILILLVHRLSLFASIAALHKQQLTSFILAKTENFRLFTFHVCPEDYRESLCRWCID